MNLIRIARNDLKQARDRGAFHLLGSLGFSQALLLLLSIALARWLGSDNFGHLRVINAVLKLALIPAALGIPAAIAKYASEFRRESRKKMIFTQGMIFSIGSSLGFSLLLFLFLIYFNPLGDEVARHYLLVLVWTIPASIITAGGIAYFQGRKKIKRMALYQALLVFIRVILAGGSTYFFGLRGFAGGIILAEFAGAFILIGLTRKDWYLRWNGEIFKKMLRLGAFASLGLAFANLTLTMDTLCLSALLQNPVIVGRYGAAITLAMGLMLIPTALSQTVFPYLSEICRQTRRLRRHFWHLFIRVGIIMLIVCGVVFFLAGPIIRILFGREYGPAADWLKILLPGIFFYSLQIVSGITLFARGRTDLNLYVTLVGGVLNLLLNILLISTMGGAGAAWATSITYLIRLIVSLLFLFKRGLKSDDISPDSHAPRPGLGISKSSI